MIKREEIEKALKEGRSVIITADNQKGIKFKINSANVKVIKVGRVSSAQRS